MKSVLKILTFALIATSFLGAEHCYGKTASSRAAADPFATPQERKDQSFAVIKGEHITQIFAQVCSQKNFSQFRAWAQHNYFELKQFDSPTYQVSQSEIKDDELLFSVKIESNKWQANIRDQKFEGQDPCEVANNYLDSRQPHEHEIEEHQSHGISLFDILIPQARAERLVNESTTTNWLLGALATAALTDGAFIENLSQHFSLSENYLFAVALRSASTANQEVAQTNLEQLLTEPPQITCSKNRVYIYGKDLHIIVKKGYRPYRLGFEDNKNDKPLANESKILASGKIHDHLISLAQTCDQEEKADALNAQLKNERELLNQMIAKDQTLNREISSE